MNKTNMSNTSVITNSDEKDSSLFTIPICQLLGIMAASGHMNLIDSCAYVKQSSVSFIKSFFPVSYYVHERIWQDEPLIIRVFWKSTIEFPIDCQMMYFTKNINDKYIPDDVIRLPKEKLKCFLVGFVEGNAIKQNDSYILRISSKRLATGIVTILTKLGIYHKKNTIENVEMISYGPDARHFIKKTDISLIEISNQNVIRFNIH
jgi:hypothetical protein